MWIQFYVIWWVFEDSEEWLKVIHSFSCYIECLHVKNKYKVCQSSVSCFRSMAVLPLLNHLSFHTHYLKEKKKRKEKKRKNLISLSRRCSSGCFHSCKFLFQCNLIIKIRFRCFWYTIIKWDLRMVMKWVGFIIIIESSVFLFEWVSVEFYVKMRYF